MHADKEPGLSSLQPTELPRDVEDNDAEWQRAGGPPTAAPTPPRSVRRAVSHAAASAQPPVEEGREGGEFETLVPAELPRDVEDNDMEWQRAGGAPEE